MWKIDPNGLKQWIIGYLQFSLNVSLFEIQMYKKKKKKKSQKQKKYYNNNNNKHKLTKKTMIPRKVNSICLILFTHWTFRIIFLSIYINYEIIHKQSIILEIRIISDDMKLHCLPILFLFSCSWKSTIFNFIYLWHFI
jgi:hypothetical protein